MFVKEKPDRKRKLIIKNIKSLNKGTRKAKTRYEFECKIKSKLHCKIKNHVLVIFIISIFFARIQTVVLFIMNSLVTKQGKV